MTKVYFADVPDDKTVMAYIKTKLNWNEAVLDVGGVREDIIEEPIKRINNSDFILNDVYDIYLALGAVNWQSRDACNLYGLSLSYNRNNAESSWKLGSFGEPRYQVFDSYSYYNVVEHDINNRVKGDYLDSLGFRAIHPIVNSKRYLSAVFNTFALPVHRVTARTINGTFSCVTAPGTGGMHRDESYFESLRINVCLSNNGCFGLQYLNKNPTFSIAGDVNFINTMVLHRPYIVERCNFQRTHLIINVSPWLDYDATNDCWSPNKYFGKMHPIEMVKQGLMFKQGKI